MDQLLEYKSVPFGSILTLPDDNWQNYIPRILALPQSLQKLIFSSRTGAFIRGTVKTYNAPLEKSPFVAFAILQIFLGEKKLTQLASTLTTELSISPDTAGKIAREIEKELFAPIALEFGQYLSVTEKIPSPQAGGARNVLDLKTQNRPPVPPPIPSR